MNAPLTDPWFEAKFYGRADAKGHWYLESIDGAQGLLLWCPCGYGNTAFPLDGARPHAMMVPFANPRNAPMLPPDHGPFSKKSNSHPRWQMSGSSLADLTVSPSVDVGEPTCWHGFVQNGRVT